MFNGVFTLTEIRYRDRLMELGSMIMYITVHTAQRPNSIGLGLGSVSVSTP